MFTKIPFTPADVSARLPERHQVPLRFDSSAYAWPQLHELWNDFPTPPGFIDPSGRALGHLGVFNGQDLGSRYVGQ